MKIYNINTPNFKVDGGAMFGVIPKSMWQKVYPADENNMCNLANRCLLVDNGNRRILIDTGIGDKHNEKFLSHIYVNGNYDLLTSLKEAGYEAEDITDVIFTHLHWDHCAGATKYSADKTKIELTFPNAIHWTSAKQWNWAMNPNIREKAAFQAENLLPIKENGNLKLIENNTFLYDGIEIRIYDGHTKGMISVIIHTKDKTIALPADLIPTTAHFSLPWISAYDIEPMLLLKEKEEFLNEAYEKNWILFFEHDIFTECCTLQKTEKGIKENTRFLLKEIF